MTNNYYKRITIYPNDHSIVKLLTIIFHIAKKLKACIHSSVSTSTKKTSACYLSKYFIISLLVMGVGSVSARNITISTNTNWSAITGGTPNSSDIITINGATLTVDVATAVCASIQIGSTANGTLLFNANSQVTVSGTITLGMNTLIGTITMSSGGTLSCNALAVAGSGTNIWTPGTGTVIMTATNTLPTKLFTSFNNLTISGGTTTLGVAIPIVSGILTVKTAATLALSTFALGATTKPTSLVMETGTIAGSSITGTGILNLAGAGGVTINNVGAGAVAASITAPITLGAAQIITNNATAVSPSFIIGTGSITNGANLLTVGGSGNTSISSGIGSGSGGLIMNGSGTLILSGANAYTGATTISTGTLKLGSPTALGTGATSITSGAVLDLNGTTYTNTNALTIIGTGLSSNGALINSSATAATFNGAITLASASYIGTTGNITLGGVITGGYDLTKVGSATLSLGSSTATLGALIINAGTFTTTSGTLNLSGNFTNNGTFTPNSGTVNFTGTSTTIGGSATSTTFNNVSLSGSATVNTGMATIIGGNLSIANGTTFQAQGFNLTVSGTTTVGNGASGILNVTSSAGTKLFTGLVTIKAGATWNNYSNSDVEFQGNITNSGTFISGTGIYTFDTNSSQTLTGTLTIQNVTVNSPAVLTNTGTLIVGTALNGTGGLTQGGTASLNIAGTCGINALDASSGTNTVSYTYGYAQNAFPTTYYNLTLSGNAKTFATPPTVNGTLDLLTWATISITGGGTSVIYGPNATLRYDLNPSGRAILLAEWPTPFTASGGVILGTGQSLQLNSVTKAFSTSVPFIINNNSTLTCYGSTKFIFGGDFIENGSGNISSGNPTDIEITGTVNQNIAGFNNNGGNLLMTKTSGTATLTSAVTAGSFNLSGTGLSLGNANHTTGTLYLGGAGQPAASWGGSGSAATFKNSTYFAPVVTGILNVTTKSCIAGSWIGITNTDWSTATNWCDGTVPTSATNVIINPAVNQPVIGAGVSANCNSLTVNSGATLTTASGTNSLTVSGDLTINSGASLTVSGINTLTLRGNCINNGGTFNPGTGTVTFNAGNNYSISGTSTTQTFYNLIVNNTQDWATLSVAGSTTALVVGGTFILSKGEFIAPATMSVGSDFTLASTLAGYSPFTAGASLTVGGNWVYNSGTFNPGTGTSTVTMTGTSRTIGGSLSTTFNNLSLSGTASVSNGIATTVGGNLNIGDGTTLTAAFPLSVSKTTTVGGGASGNLTISSATGTKIFKGQVTIANNATWNNSANSAVEFQGGIITTPTFTAGSGVQSFTTNAQALSGTFIIPSTTVTGVTLTNNNALTVATALSGSGNLTQAAGSTLNLGALSNITTLTAINSNNTVNYTGAAQSVNSTGFYNLSFSGSAAKTIATGTSVSGNLSISGATASINTGLNISVGSLTLGGLNRINGTWGSTTATTATHQDNTYFAATTGYLTVTNDTRVTTPTFSGLTASQSICSGTATTTLSGTDSAAGPAYPLNGETVGVTINGILQNTTISGATGGFSISYNSSTLPAGTYPITYSYAGNTSLKPNSDASTSLTVNSNPSAPTTTGAAICIGTVAGTTLSASGAVAGQKYNWYSAATGGTLLYPSVDNTDNTFTTPVIGATTSYWVTILNASGCESQRAQVTATYPSVCTDVQTSGTDFWNGYVYSGQNTNFASNIYFGHYTEAETFNESFGAGNDNYCFPITSNSNALSINTTNFTVRYLMTSSRKGLYAVDLGSDDGSRLTVDGNLLYNNWGNHSYAAKTSVLLNLTGSSSLVYDYSENGGTNQVVFQNLIQLIANNLSSNTTQSINLGNSGTSISGDVFNSLPTGIALSGTGYQWTYSKTPGGTRTVITGATAATYIPTTTTAPFNTPGTFYLYRNAVLSSTNNVSPITWVATNESNAAIITVGTFPTITTSLTSLTGFTYIHNAGPSAQQSFTVSGINLSSGIIVTPPADFEISKTSGSGFQSTPITLTQSGGIVTTTTIYIRLKSLLPIGNFTSENIVFTSNSAVPQNVAASGTVTTATYYSIATGNWNVNTTWSYTSGGLAVGGGIYPLDGDIVNIEKGLTVSVISNAACSSLNFTTATTGTLGTLTVSAADTLAVSGVVTLNNYATNNVIAYIAGGGALTCSSVNLGSGAIPNTANTTYTHTLTSTINTFTIPGNLSIRSYIGSYTSRRGNGVFTQTSGTVTVNGSIMTINADGNNTSTFTLGNSSPTLFLGGATPFGLSSTGTNTISLNGTGATVNYSYAGAQPIGDYTYTNLTLTGSGIKAENAATVNGILTMGGAATMTGTPTYGTNSTLQYQGTVAQTTGPEFLTPFPGSGGLIINNTNGVTLNTAKSINALTLMSGILNANTFLLSVTGTTPLAITGGSTTSYVNGPLSWSLPTISSAVTYNFPVGNTTYLPFSLVNPVTSGAATAQVQAFTTNCNGTSDATLDSISHKDYWMLIPSSSITNTSVSLARQTAIAPLNVIAYSSGVNSTGTYTSFGGVSGVNGVTTSNTVTIGSTTNRYFVFGKGKPIINTSVTALNTFSYVQGFGPSNQLWFTVSGANLTTNITVLPTDSFDISLTSGSSFVPQPLITVLVNNGIVAPTTIYVQMKAGFSAGSITPKQNIACTSDNAINQYITCSGVVTNAPAYIVTPPALSGFGYTFTAGPSAQSSFTVSATNLYGSVIMTPPPSYEISTVNGGPYQSTPITYTFTGAAPFTLSTKTIYVRMKIALGVGNANENIVITSPNATPVNVLCSGTVIPAPTINISTSALAGFIYTAGSGPSGAQSFTVSGNNLTSTITLTAPANFEISSTSATGPFASTLTLTQTGGNVPSTTIWVRIKINVGAMILPPSNLTLVSAGATTQNITLSGSVITNSPTTPTILSSKSSLSGFTYFVGSGPSDLQSFTVSGTSLSAILIVTSPVNYEICRTSSGTFKDTIQLRQISGNVNAIPIYVRLKSTLVIGTYPATPPANITLTSTGATTKNVACSGSVTNIPTITAGITGGGSVCPNTAVTLTSSGTDLINQYWEGPNSYYSISASPALGTLVDGTKNGKYVVTGNALTGPNLITNGDFELGNTGFGSSYTPRDSTYTNYPNTSYGALTAEGNYSVLAIPHNAHINFTTNGDHTPAPGKYQMVINGAGTAGVVVWSQTVTTLANAIYQFTYWVQTVCLPRPSQLQLYVNGVKSGQIYTADSLNVGTTAAWTQFAYNVIPGNTTVTNLQLINQNTAIGGNDFALDDIVLRKVYPVKDSVNLTVNPTMPVSVSITSSINPLYSGGSVTFTANPVNGGTTPAYQWIKNGVNTGVNSSTYTFTPSIGDSVRCILTSSYPCTTGSPASSNKMITLARTNFWVGTYSSDWGTPTNWSGGYIPLPGNDVEYATAANSPGNQAIKDLQLDQSRTIGTLVNATNKKLIIPVNTGLIVNNTISTNQADSIIDIKSNSGDVNGYLIFHNSSSSPVHATVEMYSPAFCNNQSSNPKSDYKWQYFGIPIDTIRANPTLAGSYVRSWDERQDSVHHWVSLTNDSIVKPFYGYEITQVYARTVNFPGKLINRDFNSGVLAISPSPPASFPGQHIFANPYTAAINIKYIIFGSDAEHTVYLYNTGSLTDWKPNRGVSSSNNPGQYTSIPQATAGNLMQLDVPSMQAMLIRPNPKSSTFNNFTFGISYNLGIMKNIDQQKVAANKTQTTTDGIVGTLIELTGTNFSDRMWLFSQSGCNRTFDNGWDGVKMLGTALAPQIFAIEPDNNYQVDAVDDINNTILGFRAGEDSEYTITFTHQNLKSKYEGVYLLDLVENKTTDITESGTAYSFVTESTPTTVKRFMIATRPYEKNASDANTQLKVFSSGSIVFIQNLGNLNGEMVIYDMMGRKLKKVTFGPYGISAVQMNTIPGAYVVNAATTNERVSKRIILGN